MPNRPAPPALRPVVSVPLVLVLARGTTDQDRANNRGRLFEAFVARLLEVYGYDPPTSQSLNVTSDGIELDVVTNQSLTGQPAIAECKAYSANVPAHMLDAFYGKLAVARLQTSETVGMFVALPGLTQPGYEQARTIQAADSKFLLLTAEGVVAKLTEKNVLRQPPPDPTMLLSDLAVVVVEDGVFSAAKQLDRTTRLPEVVRVWGAEEHVPDPVLELLTSSDYAAGLPIRRLVDPLPLSALGAVEEPRVVEVVGGQGDFDYQLPTAPRFFVGRRLLLSQLEGLVVPPVRQGRVVVLNAQSGWGKSSLALRFKAQVESLGGLALILDARTAVGPDFVRVALRNAAIRAQGSGLLTLPDDASFAGLVSALDTLAASSWSQPPQPLVLFFDQFEGVFQDERLTREFRDLALATSELPVPFVVGFAWKTDLLGWTESHPYRLRDEIRDRAAVLTVAPLGPPEITILLGRLEREVGAPLLAELKQRLREYSQGLPWLFKKLASHLLRELGAGKTQEALLSERLNVQALFESDLGQLGPREQAALRAIARRAPVAVSDALELADPSVVQTLVHQRLVVQVGERLDVYWDIFRDFLNTGRVPVEETYILRVTPPQVSRLLSLAIASGGEESVPTAADALGTTEGVVFNAARDLRQLGVFVASPGHVRVAEEIMAAGDKEEAVREHVARVLRRHRAFSLLVTELESQGGEITVAMYAEIVPQAFPAVQAQPKTWAIYTRAFVAWFSYARLISKVGHRVRLGTSAAQTAQTLLGGARLSLRRPHTFPQSPPGPALDIARLLAGIPWQMRRVSRSTIAKSFGDLVALGVAEVDEERNLSLTTPNLVRTDGTIDGELLLALLARVGGGSKILELVESDPEIGNLTLGRVVADALGANWRDGTAAVAGKHFRAWIRAARGERPRRRRVSRRHVVADSLPLFPDEPT
jgi:Restriction endonuclease